ncbi:hypothetical protein G6F57_012448 [Rhizopus arrhizus]|jgi:hypothetical protein|uniref:Uncharacterized protein n=1 Tax=Rhizopus oryzae TaxID=64495 RepID=A0A9P7BMM4_RHIOR|nr:hypothetical protein G6F23_008662 [Rhizopus arrhizus]KAG1046487.1 hypothetical protein G6F43_011029 [Rhizopus delemar]KAG0761362.1 hypothetical protein G6F24_007627 [Rhizopus arrhizus]KAG0785637.1 hypothetical protein G6F21_009130 [Rhizopus arrhizus]KAG0786303.1 hypothetical protein G6F22_007673 [Rhizopus arrhizus]
MRSFITALFIALLTFTLVNAEESVVLSKRKASYPYANPPVLTDGTLFYIGVAVTCFLWTTGKMIDVKLHRQEKYAESVARSA